MSKLTAYFDIDVANGGCYVIFNNEIVALLRDTFNIPYNVGYNTKEFEEAVNSSLKDGEITAVGKIPSSGEYFIRLGMLLRITNDERCPYKVVGTSATKNFYGDLCTKFHFVLKSSPIKDKTNNCE